MSVDLDSYDEPLRDEEALAHRREALLGQLEWLVSEAEALEPLLKDLPKWAFEQAPTEEARSVKETFALLHAIDERVTLTWLERLESGGDVSLETPKALPLDTESDVAVLLGRLRASRSRVVEWLRKWDERQWKQSLTMDGQETNVYGLALAIAQRDADLLRDVAYQLHGADLDRAE